MRALLARLDLSCEELEEYGEMRVDNYLQDRRSVHASKYLLLTTIEDALAIANHVIASEGFRAPADYADAFRSLVESRILERDLGKRLEAMAGFRNLLVHVYAEIDNRRVHTFLQRDLADLESFSQAIVERFTQS